ncbi:hypothetical protein HWV62_18132 [Athelia sp. TMB]|nr:hypothetical protein HWV62_18132 [Athelia sp. TMB]
MLAFLYILLFAGVASSISDWDWDVPIPDNDPFYDPPFAYELSNPGSVLRDRTVSSGIIGVSAVQLLYRTTYTNGSAGATVATIFTGALSFGTRVVAFSEPEDSVNTTCAPSYLFSTGNGSAFYSDIGHGLANGWTVVIADYEGPGSAFTAGRQAGYAVLDAIRAAFNYGPLGVDSDATVGAYGYSGGAIATGWAASLQQTYAPELNVKGWAFGGTPANITAALQNVEGTVWAGLAVAGFAGTMAAYPALAKVFDKIATDRGRDTIANVQSQCENADLSEFSLLNFENDIYQSLGDQLFYDPIVAAVFANGTMGLQGSLTPTAPIYMYHGAIDEVIPYSIALQTAAFWCTHLANIEFVTETGGTGHVGTLDVLGTNATDWLDLRLSGTPPPLGCSFSSWNASGTLVKRDGEAGRGVARFGRGDENIANDMKQRVQEGRSVPSLWSYRQLM